MKALITGPRSRMDSQGNLPYLHLETEFEELPKPGEHIIINDGDSVTVERVMWWVDGPDTPEAHGGKYEGAGVSKTIHIQVKPDDWPGSNYPEGVKAGRIAAAQDLEQLMKILTSVTRVEDLRSVVGHWIAKELQEEVT